MPTLALERVTKLFGREVPVVGLDDVTLDINQGQFVAVVGPSGSGKSTLLNILAALDQPTAGRYLLDGVDVGQLSEADRSRVRSDTFGFIFQSFHLMPRRTARENVEVGLLYRAVPRAQRRVRAEAALEQVGLAHRIDTQVRKLSGGECQRVAIARAIVASTPILVADEPTGNLDSENSRLVMEHLAAIVEGGATVVLVTHDLDVASAAATQITMRDGRVAHKSGRAIKSQGAEPLPPLPGRSSRIRSSDLMREAYGALTSRPGRSAILIGAVALALGLIVATAGLSQSASSQVSSRFDVQRNRDVSVDVPLIFDAGGRARVDLPDSYPKRLRDLAGVRSVGRVDQRDRVTVVNPVGSSTSSVIDLHGVADDALKTLDTQIVWAGNHSQRLQPGEVLLGKGAAEAVDLGPLALDPSLRIRNQTVRVVGIISASRRLPALANAIVAAAPQAAGLNNLTGSTIYVSVDAGAGPQVAQQSPIALDPYRPERFQAHAPVDPRALRDQIQGDVRSTLLVLSIVASLASILGVANAMMLGVLERVGELGLRRAIGARPSHILAQTGLESLLIGGLGGVLGLVGGLAVVLGVTISRGWAPVFDLRLAPVALAGGLLVGALGGSAASIRASRVQPADALRQ